jgi:cyclohexyl-isocyanide hydratase
MTERFEVLFTLYPRVTQLDFTGPYEVFSRLPDARCVLASSRGGTIQAEGGLIFSDTVPLASVQRCDLMCVPGGFGTVDALADEDFLRNLRRLAAQARYVTSICTGSLLLAAAGLLQGKKAACHWAWRHLLAQFGVEADPARVVRDGSVITGGGVTAGIDMALTVMAEIAGPRFAQAVQLGLEYAPEPPYDCGRPERAAPEVLQAVLKRMQSIDAEREAAVRRAAQLDLAPT